MEIACTPETVGTNTMQRTVRRAYPTQACQMHSKDRAKRNKGVAKNRGKTMENTANTRENKGKDKGKRVLPGIAWLASGVYIVNTSKEKSA